MTLKTTLSALTAACLLVCLFVCLLSGTAEARRRPAKPPVVPVAPAAAPPALPSSPWHNVEIVGGGFVPGIIFSTRQPGLIYARTDIGGAYRWDGWTHRWIPLTDWVGGADSNLLGIESLAADPVNAKRVYLAAGTYTQSWAGNGAILRSADQGQTWQRTDMPFKMGGNEDGRSIGERLSVDPHQNSILFFGSRSDGLWKSGDFGATWSKVDSFPVTGPTNGIGIGFVLFDAHTGSGGRPSPVIYVGVDAPGVNLYRSADGGATWEAVPGQPTGLLPHHGAFDSQGNLYLTYGDKPGPNGMTDGAVWRLDARGVWTDITPLKFVSTRRRPGGFGYAGLGVDAARPGTLMVATMDKWSTGDDIFRTVDGGANWTALKPNAVRDSRAAPFLNFGGSTAALGHWIGSLVLDPFHPNHALYGTGATIWGSDDVNAADTGQPTHWTVRAQGLEETAVLDLISPPAGPHLISALGDIGGFRHDALTVSPPGGLWTNPTMTTVTSLDFAENSPGIVAKVGNGANGQNGAYSLDGASTWTPFPVDLPDSKGGGTIAVTADGRNFIWTAPGGRPYFSFKRGATWTACVGAPDGLRIVTDRVNSHKAYGWDSNTGKFYTSDDWGVEYAAQPATLPKGHSKVRPAPGHEGDLWLPAGSDGLYHSTDGGATFAPLGAVQSADALGFGRAAPGKTYPAVYLAGKVGGVSGVFRSNDAGLTWTRINDDAHQYGWIGQVLTGDPRLYGRVYLGTNGRGILYADLRPGAAP